jgi:hypothetical protein
VAAPARTLIGRSGRGGPFLVAAGPSVFPGEHGNFEPGGPMSEHDDLLHNMFTAAAADLRPLLDEAAEQLELTVGQVVGLGHFLGTAWVAGAKAGQAEMMAQAIEQGIEVRPQVASRDDGEEPRPYGPGAEPPA